MMGDKEYFMFCSNEECEDKIYTEPLVPKPLPCPNECPNTEEVEEDGE